MFKRTAQAILTTVAAPLWHIIEPHAAEVVRSKIYDFGGNAMTPIIEGVLNWAPTILFPVVGLAWFWSSCTDEEKSSYKNVVALTGAVIFAFAVSKYYYLDGLRFGVKFDSPIIESAKGRQPGAALDVYTNVVLRSSAINAPIENALPFVASICKLDNNEKCIPDVTFTNNVQICWHNLTCKKEILLDRIGDSAVPFIAYDRGKSKRTTDIMRVLIVQGTDNTCSWCDDMPVGKYKFSLIIRGSGGPYEQSYILDWYGDYKSLNIKKE